MYTKIIQSGDLTEVYQFEKTPNIKKNVYRKKRQKKRDRKPDEVYSRRTDNVARLRNAFVRLVRSNLGGNEPPAFLTLTMYEVVSVRTAYTCFQSFILRLRRRFGREFRYIAVPEFQQRGAVHFHVLIWGEPTKYADIILNKTLSQASLRETDTRSIQALWRYGTCDYFLTDGSPKLAGYLTKYMSKALHDKRLCGEKAYTASRNVMRPVQVSSLSSSIWLGEVIGEDMDTVDKSVDNSSLVHVKEFDTMWLGRTIYKRYINKKPL